MLNISPAKKYIENKNYANIINMPTKLISKNIYSHMFKNVALAVSIQEKWPNYINLNHAEEINWFTHIFNITTDNVLRTFQFKLLHKIIYFNDMLYIFNISNTT